jgi:hypothetical protein
MDFRDRIFKKFSNSYFLFWGINYKSSINESIIDTNRDNILLKQKYIIILQKFDLYTFEVIYMCYGKNLPIKRSWHIYA